MKHHIPRDVHAARLSVIALVTFVVWTVAEKDTLFGIEREFVRVIGAKIR
jgi:hypothetical protein